MSKATKSDVPASIRCLINLHKMPITRFEMLVDRNGFKRARARRQVLEIIGSKANPDGTGSYVSDTFLAEKTGFTEKYLWSLRQELKALGLLVWVDKRGFGAAQKSTWGSNDYTVSTNEAWPRRHGVKKLNSGEQLNPVLSDAEVQDSEGLNPVLLQSNPVIPEHKTTLNPVVSELNPVLISTDYRPSLPPLEATALPTAPTGPEGGSGAVAKTCGHETNENNIPEILSHLANVYAAEVGEYLNLRPGAGMDLLVTLVAEQGAAKVKEFWPLWIKTRKGVKDKQLDCPLLFYCPEFPQTVSIVRKVNEDALSEANAKSAKLGNVQRAQDSEIRVQQWKDGLAAATDIDTYVLMNPAPKWIVAGEKENYQLPYADEAIADEWDRRQKREQKAQENTLQVATADVI